MKRVFIILGILIVALSAALMIRLKQVRAHLSAPAGGSGTIEGTEVDVVPRLSARISRVLVVEGQKVEQGEVLVELCCDEPKAMLAEAEARLLMAHATAKAAGASAQAAAGTAVAASRQAQASKEQSLSLEAQRTLAEREAQRLTALFESGSATATQRDRVHTTAESATQNKKALEASYRAALAQADAAYRGQLAASAQGSAALHAVQAAEAVLRRARVAVAECTLVAPRGGFVLRRNYEPGEVVLPGARVLTLTDIAEVKATFYLPNAELSAAEPGKKVLVRADAYREQSFEGVIRRVSSEAEFTPRNVQTREDRDRLVYGVEIALPNAESKLRPGMPVEIAIVGTGR